MRLSIAFLSASLLALPACGDDGDGNSSGTDSGSSGGSSSGSSDGTTGGSSGGSASASGSGSTGGSSATSATTTDSGSTGGGSDTGTTTDSGSTGGSGTGGAGPSNAECEQFCMDYYDQCMESSYNDYDSPGGCVNACKTWDQTQYDCRVMHLGLVEDAEDGHCGHAGLDGDGVCT